MHYLSSTFLFIVTLICSCSAQPQHDQMLQRSGADHLYVPVDAEIDQITVTVTVCTEPSVNSLASIIVPQDPSRTREGPNSASGPAYGQPNSPSNNLHLPSEHTYPIPEEHESCYNRSNHEFSYTYSHGYHFASMTDGPKKTSSSAAGYYSIAATSTPYSTTHPTKPTPYQTLTSPLHLYNNTYSYRNLKPSFHLYNATSSGQLANSTTSSPSSKPTTGTTSLSSSFSIPPTTTTSSISSTSTATPTSTPCQPVLLLMGASETSFNKKNTPFSLTISCSQFDIQNTAAFSNFVPVDNIVVSTNSITFSGFNADYVILSIFALDSEGTPILKSYQLHFGSVDMPILVLDTNNQPAGGVSVYGNATGYPGLSGVCTTDATGHCVLANLPATTIAIVAKNDENSIAVNGLAATAGLVTLKLMPFVQPQPGASFDIANGTSGWTGGVVSQTLKIKRDTTLIVSTAAQFTLQTASNSFPVHPFTKTAYVKYKFVTAEIPGGFFGTQYNDYYSVTIRSDSGALVTVTNSMNALGLGAFDASGATDWFTLTLSVPANTKSVSYDIGVSNVVDNLYDSEVIVDKVGDLQCDQCGDCTLCPADPMCQSVCQNPAPQTCDFYRNCAEGQLGCGDSGYPLAYGEKNCNKFTNNLKYFSAAGQAWIFGTMHCLQVAMVPVLEPCTASCASFQAAAFASHAKCYVDNGVCGLDCPDVLAILMTVGSDLLTLDSLKQVIQTGAGCLANLEQTLSGCGGDVLFGGITGGVEGVAITIAIKVAIQWLFSA